MRRSKILILVVVVFFVLTFVPFVPATDPCPAGPKCPATLANKWGAPAYVFVGVGAFGAYPVMELRNESGHHIPVTDYFEGYYGLAGCDRGAGWAILYGGPWGCDFVGAYWHL